MKFAVVLGLILLLALLAVACERVNSINPLAPKCPQSCNDGIISTKDYCSANTSYKCVSEPLPLFSGDGRCDPGESQDSSDCLNCDDLDICTRDVLDYNSLSCKHVRYEICVGDGYCQEGENSTSPDCPSCNDDNRCTRDFFDLKLQLCGHNIIVPCCGNSICEKDENSFSCLADCPKSEQERLVDCKLDDNCRAGVAVAFKDTSICPLLITVNATDNCYFQVAKAGQDNLLCYNITDPLVKNKCAEEVAVLLNDSNLCLVQIPLRPNSCLERIAVKTGNSAICDLMVQEEGTLLTLPDLKIKCKALTLNNILLCKNIARGFYKDLCYESLAIARLDFTICEAKSSKVLECKQVVKEAREKQS